MARILKTAGSSSKKVSTVKPKAKVSKPAAKKVSTVKPVVVEKLDKKRCQRCSKWNPADDTICNWCEKPVKKSVKVSKPAPAPKKINIDSLFKRKCNHCGKYNPTADAECNWCEKPTRRVKADLVDTLPPAPAVKRGGQHGPSPRVTDAEYDRLFAARKMGLRVPESEKPKAEPKREEPRPLTSWTAPAALTVAAVTAPHLFIIARAGTGKTTTLIGGTQKAQGIIPRDARGNPMTPSDQQRAVWESLALSKGVRTIGLTSFSNTIVDELKDRVKGTTVAAFTLHSYGFAAVRRAFRGVVLDKSGGLYKFMLAEMMGRTLDKELYKEKGGVIEAVNSLVKQCKMNLMEPTAENLDALASHFDIEINQRDRAEVYNYVPAILDKCKAAKPGCRISFDDMIWLPVVLKLPVDKYDLLMVDEAQDLNRCQQALARMAVGDTGRLVFCGDPRQAIFGFAGADNESMDRMQRELSSTTRGVAVLKLTKTRRCAKAIVAVAQQIVPDFEAFESNPTGVVSQMRFAEGEGNFRAYCREGDMVLCRTNAPLVSQCFKFLRAGKTAVMLGRSIGEKLSKLIKDFEAVSVVDLIQKMEDWLAKERTKEEARRIPDENKLINLQDNFDCLMSFTEGAGTVEDILRKIDELFTDDRKAAAVRLASIHKSKGLEADRVFFINTEKAPCPHPMAKSDWAQEQEMNLLYVGTTRAISELVQVA